MEKSFHTAEKIVRDCAVRVVFHRVQVAEHFGIARMEIKAQVVRERQLKSFCIDEARTDSRLIQRD